MSPTMGDVSVLGCHTRTFSKLLCRPLEVSMSCVHICDHLLPFIMNFLPVGTHIKDDLSLNGILCIVTLLWGMVLLSEFLSLYLKVILDLWPFAL